MQDVGRRMGRRKPVLLLAAVTSVLMPTILAPSAAASEQSAAARSIVRDMIVSPKQDALIKRPQARASFQVPAGTNRLWVRLNDRSIAARFSRSGSLRIATLSLQSGLRYGQNTLFVLAKRSGRRRPVADSHSFVIGRRVQGLARLKMTPGPVTLVDLRAAAPRLTPSVFDSRRVFRKRLNGIRRDREARIRFNGRPVAEFFSRPQPTRWKTRLSATHGLRHGVNRLRILLLEPESGRYEVLRRRFVVPPSVPLPAAGLDLARPFGLDRMPLDAGDSRSSGGPLSYSWRILSKRRGSNPKLRRADSASALFDPDRPGRYRVGLEVSAPGSQAADSIDLIVPPSQQLLPFGFVPRREAETGNPSPPGIKVGGDFYPSPDEGTFQWLTLDRSTLRPIKTKNSSVDPRARDGDKQLDTLSKALSTGGHGDLVILAHPARTFEPLKRGQVDKFNSILKLLGVGPIPADSLTRRNEQLVIVGVPYGGDGSGSYSDRQVFTSGEPALNGWLMPDGVEAAPGIPRFRFQPEKIEFDTFNGGNNGGNLHNEMKIGGESVIAHSPMPAAAGGFQVVAIDPDSFEPIDATVDNRTFVTNFSGGTQATQVATALDQRGQMTQYLNQLAKRKVLVAVQSIGGVGVVDPPFNPGAQDRKALEDNWRDLTRAMQANGANPHTFYTADGSYAFLGGGTLDRSEMVDSSTAVKIDPTTDPPLGEGGSLQGFASARSDGLMEPAVADGSDQLQFEMYDIAFRDATPWPFTEAAGEPAAIEYRRALTYISTCLSEFDGWGPDLRSAYAGNLKINYIGAKQDLGDLPYPEQDTDSKVCPKWNFSSDPGFTSLQYIALKAELGQEFLWLDSIERLFGAAESALSRSGGNQQVDLKTLSGRIADGVKPSEAKQIGLDIGEFFLLVFEDLALIPTSVASLGFVEAVAAVYQISTAIASDASSGVPLGDQVKKKASELAQAAADRLDASANGLDRLRQVIISDYGRLRALGTVANTRAYSPDTSTMAARMTQGANQWFSSELLPVPYGVHALHLVNVVKGEATAKNCYVTLPAGFDFSRAADSAQLKFFGHYSVDRFVGQFPTLFVLALHDLHDAGDKTEYVPAVSLADSIFRPDAQGGYGLQFHRFIWEHYENKDRPGPPTNIAKCN